VWEWGEGGDWEMEDASECKVETSCWVQLQQFLSSAQMLLK